MASSLHFIELLCLTCVLWIGANVGGVSAGECKYCPEGWSRFGAHCYVYNPTEKDWADAERACNVEGGNLASIPNKDAYNAIRMTIRRATAKDERAWVGGHDGVKEGVWMWSDGTYFKFKEWGPGEPSNNKGTEHCMEINYNGGPNDATCQDKKPFVCGLRL